MYEFLSSYSSTVLALLGGATAVVLLVRNALTVKKLELEIEELKKAEHRLHVPTSEEVARYGTSLSRLGKILERHERLLARAAESEERRIDALAEMIRRVDLPEDVFLRKFERLELPADILLKKLDSIEIPADAIRERLGQAISPIEEACGRVSANLNKLAARVELATSTSQRGERLPKGYRLVADGFVEVPIEEFVRRNRPRRKGQPKRPEK